jgi:magnesium-transporting ATPase (P-type)
VCICDKVPADGVLFKGSDVHCDESALTGEPKEKAKSITDAEGDPFMLSGASVTSGFGFMVVTAVGINSRWGKIKSKLTTEPTDTPLQGK